MKQLFARSKLNPILRPNPKNAWEALKTYNCGALYDYGKYHLFYRAVGENGVSALGYAASEDGENFIRQNTPLMTPEGELEKCGVEDPRLTKVGDKYCLTYTAYDGDTARLCSAVSPDLKAWERQGEMIPNWNAGRAQSFTVSWDRAQTASTHRDKWLKAGAIFPRLIGGRFHMIFGDRHLWLASSGDGRHWEPVWEPFLRARPGDFDQIHVETGPPPLEIKDGWLVLYHGIGRDMVYRLGYLILDKNDPRRIIRRSKEPVFAPETDYELSGTIDLTDDDRPKVIFSCGATIVEDFLRIYYGAGDTTVCTATAKLADVLEVI